VAVLKIREVSTLALPLTVVDDFTVRVRHLSQRQMEQLSERCSRPRLNRATGAMEPTVDDGLWAKHAPEAYLDPDGCTGLTPSAIRKLGIELDEDPPLTEAGEIECTAELLKELWKAAHADKFALPIMRFSREMLAAAEAAKKNGSTG